MEIEDFGLPWRDVIGVLCGLWYLSAPGFLPGGMKNRLGQGMGILDCGMLIVECGMRGRNLPTDSRISVSRRSWLRINRNWWVGTYPI